MKKVILLSVSILLIFLAYSFAEVPCKINYQGRLIKDNVPVDGTVEMEFKIYDTQDVGTGTKLWGSGKVNVPVHNGLFRYVIGSDGGDLSSIDWAAGETLYLEVKVETDILTPREELSAYPYAINSHLLEGTDKSKFNVERSDVGSGVDWNILTTPGSYGVITASLTGANSPKATYSGIYTHGVVVVEEYNGRGIVQTYYPHTGTGASYIVRRTGWNNGSWQSWVKVWDAGSDGSGSGLDADLLDGQNGAYYLDGLSEVEVETYVANDVSTGYIPRDNGNKFQNSPIYAASSTGNVGIGTPSPQAKLHVGGTAGTDGIMFPDGSLQTTATSGQSSQVVGTTNISLTGTTNWTNMTNMSITIGTTGGNVLLLYSATHHTSNTNTDYGIRFTEDGTARHTIVRTTANYSDNQIQRPMSLQYLCTSLAAGSHTFKVQWRILNHSNHTLYQDGASYPRVFTVIELP